MVPSLVALALLTSLTTTNSIEIPKGCTLVANNTQIECAISELTDCRNLLDLPYARNHFCPAAYEAVRLLRRSITSKLFNTVNQSDFSVTGSLTFVQTLPDVGKRDPGDENQTEDACLRLPLPFLSKNTTNNKLGAGSALCKLASFASSFTRRPEGPTLKFDDSVNPVGAPKGQATYILHLIFPAIFNPALSLESFKKGGHSWDQKVASLGAIGAKHFKKDYKNFDENALYTPWKNLPVEELAKYRGISGGGGSGWGAEISIEEKTVLQFGGGGGGGMTSYYRNNPVTVVSSGGGGGVNIADGYISPSGKSYNGLGLGAGSSSTEGDLQYSYYKHTSQTGKEKRYRKYNKRVVELYKRELGNLKALITDSYNKGKVVTVQGGGGGGTGVEFLRYDGDEYVPHGLSTQAGFYFNFSYKRKSMNQGRAGIQMSKLYKALSGIMTDATDYAREKCGGYVDYACMCEAQNAYVYKTVKKEFGKVPKFLTHGECPKSTKSS